MAIPEANLPESLGIPALAGQISGPVEDPETEPYLISFQRYNDDECELGNGAMGPYSLDALKAIKGMGTQVPCVEQAGRIFGVPTTPVFNENEYSRLFRGISDPEIDMREVKLEGKIPVRNFHLGKERNQPVNNGRIFFYPVRNTLYVVAIRATHYETTKR